MNLIDEIKNIISTELQEFSAAFESTLKSDNDILNEINSYIIRKKGKQLRPIIVILSAKLCGEVTHKTIDAALAIELLHTASLIHDDIVDHTTERRGKPSINKNWSNKIAVFTGDFMFSKSLYCATKTENMRILSTISQIGANLTKGELQQLNTSLKSSLSEEMYYTIIKNKTAELFASCSLVGGLSADASDEELNHLQNYGTYLGMSFQIKDDIFDYLENIQIGKPTGNDIRDGKITLPLIYALQNTPQMEADKMKDIIENGEFTETNIQLLTRFAHQNGGIEYAISQMEKFKNKAIDELSIFGPSDQKSALIRCAEYAANRNF